SIGEEAFRSCEALKEIVIPSQIQSIRTRALGLPNRGFLSITFVDYGDTQCRIAIHGIDIPENLKEIKTDKANRVLQQSLITKKSIPVAWCSYIQEANAEECANVLLYQSMKAWKVWLSAYEKNAGEILMNAVMLVQDVNKISSSSATRLLEYAFTHLKYIDRSVVVSILEVLRNKEAEKQAMDFMTKTGVKEYLV
ncbi:MAG: hypothetical protein GX671_08855, partial [Clostridiales bacterium]|nr:hypothetical protein [Clostridiales bacterium]